MVVAISPELAAALAGPGPDAVESFANLYDFATGTKIGTVELETCVITQDASAPIRATVAGVIPSLENLIPDVVFTGTNRKFGDGTFGSGLFGDYRRRYLRGLMVPLKTEIRVAQRFLLPNTVTDTSEGTWETVTLGRFILQDPAFADSPEGDTLAFTGLDYSSVLAQSQWTTPFVVAAGTNAATAVRNIIQSRFPAAVVDTSAVAGDTQTTGRIIYAGGEASGSNPWLDVIDFCNDFGWDIYVTRTGTFKVEPTSDGASETPAWALTDNGTALRFTQTPSGSNLVNTVAVYGEGTEDDPVSAVVSDTAGPYGTVALGRQIVREFTSTRIKTNAQATNVANRLLRKWGRLTETVVVDSKPAPHIDTTDVATVSSDSLELEDTRYVVDRITYSLDYRTPTVFEVSRRF